MMRRERESTNAPFQQTGGSVLNPGDWIEIDLPGLKGVGIGRFSGVWTNPDHGPMFRISDLRYVETGKKNATVFCPLKPATRLSAALEAARIADGPLSRQRVAAE